jgi:hypothetical protein
VKTLSKNIVWQKNLAYRKLQCKPFTSVAAPGPTKSGITSACNKYAEAVSGDGCTSFAQEHGVTTTELYAWNTMLGSGGPNCATALWAGNYYCVGVTS